VAESPTPRVIAEHPAALRPVRPHSWLALDPAQPELPGDRWRASSPPIYQTATFEQEDPGSFGRYDYARSGNPTRETLERHAARLEGAVGARAFSSGMAAIAAATSLVRSGGRIVAHRDLYGGTQRWLGHLASHRGIDVVHTDLVDGELDAIERGCDLVLVESLSNPLWRAPDLPRLIERTRRVGALLAVDATAMSPWLQQPIALGADLVIHSATKLLAGHADTTAGLVAARDTEILERIGWIQNAEGTSLGPFDSWLLLRGMRTLGVRLERQQQSACRIAHALEARDDLLRVHHPSLASHPDHERHHRQAEGPGSVLSIETGSEERSLALLRHLRLFAITVSFGSIDSTASLPCRMSHASVPAALRAVQSLPRDLIRLSIGLEEPEELLDDLVAALAKRA
jgi:cysteine-S-conjugate beta-lyase